VDGDAALILAVRHMPPRRIALHGRELYNTSMSGLDTAEGAQRPLTFNGRVRSLSFAARGIRTMLATQHNAWIHAAATLLVVATAFALRLSIGEWCWIVLAIVAVWTAEALNTAFEFLTDVASPTFHPLAGQAKDVAAGAVLLAAVGAVIIGALVFGPKMWTLFL